MSRLQSLGIFLLLLVGLFILIDHYEAESKKTSTTSSGTAISSVATASTASTKRRTYYRGVRLEELLGWTASEATEALVSYATQMEGEEREALFESLPLIANRILGLETGPGTPRGWLNEQALMLQEPNRNLRGAAQLAQRLLDLLGGSPVGANKSSAVPVLPAAAAEPVAGGLLPGVSGSLSSAFAVPPSTAEAGARASSSGAVASLSALGMKSVVGGRPERTTPGPRTPLLRCARSIPLLTNPSHHPTHWLAHEARPFKDGPASPSLHRRSALHQGARCRPRPRGWRALFVP